jgi:hypothetical protein
MNENLIGPTQPEMMGLFLKAIDFLLLQPESSDLTNADLRAQWKSIKDTWHSRLHGQSPDAIRSLKFKDLEIDFTPWFKTLFQHGVNRGTDRVLLAQKFEEIFQRFRFEAAYQKVLVHLLSQVFNPDWNDRTHSGGSLFVPACGSGFEMHGIMQSFPKSKVWMCDISAPDIAACTAASKNLAENEKQRLSISVCDLLKDPLCPEGKTFSMILWFHPMLTTNAQYGEIVTRVHRAGNDKQAREAVALGSVSSDFKMMFQRVLDAMSPDGLAAVSLVEEAECILFTQLADELGFTCTVYKNSFALKKASTYLVPRRPPKVLEPRTYYYWVKVQKG